MTIARQKLIEVVLPLKDINIDSPRSKHGSSKGRPTSPHEATSR